MTLVRGWLQWTIQHVVVNLELGLNQGINCLSDLSVEVEVEGVNNRLEDDCDGFELHFSVGHDVELTLHALSDF